MYQAHTDAFHITHENPKCDALTSLDQLETTHKSDASWFLIVINYVWKNMCW